MNLLQSTLIEIHKLSLNTGQIPDVPKNPRFIRDERFKKLVKSLEDNPEMLPARELLVYNYDGELIVIGGNMRLRAAKELGYKEIPCKILEDLTAEQIRAIVIKDNVSFGSDDFEQLANEWDSIELEEWGLEVPTFEDLEPELEAVEDDYTEPENMQVDVCLGDLIEIGQHRLLCGDSTDSEQVARLMNGEKAELLLTDPPYGIDYGGMLKGKGDGKGGADKNGWKSYDAPDWDKSKPESGVLQYFCSITNNQIIWGGNYFTDDLPPTMGWLIWDKGQRGFSLADGEMAWTSFNNALRIKEYARALANQEVKNHPTQKPIEIIKWCFEYADRHSKKEIKLILDAYLGSGSTMVAAHQLKRKCYGMELDPKYCQVIIDRMQKLDSSLKIKINGKDYIKN